ncbi:MAG: hypothetical protein HY903_22485 [Deltaproteobacteria bacterium]|nr:hypothetical protein [Deltaproteobacteria bacterium]
MRRAALAAALRAMDAGGAVSALETLIRGVISRRAGCVAVYTCLIDANDLVCLLPAAHLDAMLVAGRAAGHVVAAQWLLSPQAPASATQVESEALIDSSLKDVPLGRRRALARTARGEASNRLARDPDFAVVTNLLANPHTTEQLVLRIASRRPTVSRALEAVLRSPKWGRRYPVRLALANNPYLAPRLAVNLLPFLSRRDLQAVKDDAALTATLRLAAQRLLLLERS